MPPLSVTFIPTMLDLIKESWDKPSSSLQISRCTENHYKTHGPNTNFLTKLPTPKSIIVESNQSRAWNKSSIAPTNREGRKLDTVGRRLYSLTLVMMRVANYQAAMGVYHRQLWNKILPLLEAAPVSVKSEAITIHTEASTLTKQQRIASHDTADAASKAMATSVALRRRAWL